MLRAQLTLGCFKVFHEFKSNGSVEPNGFDRNWICKSLLGILDCLDALDSLDSLDFLPVVVVSGSVCLVVSFLLFVLFTFSFDDFFVFLVGRSRGLNLDFRKAENNLDHQNSFRLLDPRAMLELFFR